MTEKNPWGNDLNQPAENPGAYPEEPNPWSSEPQQENPWVSPPETTAFPPVNGSQQAAPWNETSDFDNNAPHHGAPQSHGNYNEPHFGPSGHTQHEQHQVPPQAPPRRKGRWAIPVVIVLALIALVAGAVVLANQAGWLNFTSEEDEEPAIVTEIVVVPAEDEDPADADDSPSGDDDTQLTVEDAASNEEDEKEVEEAARPSRVSLPGNAFAANSSARTGTPDGDFNNVYTGSSVTSQEFARQVRSAFSDFYNDTGETSGNITAYSPVTGLYYSLSCQDNGSFITCTGGNNAIVYIS